MDILSKELDLALTKDVFRPHPLCHDPLVTHLSFADDVLIFFDGSERSLNGILHTLTLFHQASGLGLNLQKSCLFLDGNNSDFASDLAARHGLLQGSLPVRYLGLPLMPHKLGPQDYQVLLDKVLARLSSWTTRHLSFAGRLQLIQSVIYSIINFWASVFPLPQGCLDALGKICNAFLWSGAPNSARGAKVAWESVCTPKKEGGLGIRNLNGLNQVFGLKLIWLLFAGNGSLWVAWIEKVILNGKHFWSHDFQRTGSWIWRRLMKLRSLARPFLSCQVRSGSSAFFWHDDWTNLGPLIDITGPNGPRVSGIPSLAKVSQSCANDSWLIPRGRHPILCLLRQCLPQQVHVFSQESDFFLWRNIPNAPPSVFSTSKTWTTLHPPAPPVSWFKSVWFKERIPKHAFMLWIAIRDRLTTRDRLRSWGMNVPSDCLLCTSSAENRSHLFFECVYSNEVWSSFFTHPDLSPPPLFEDIVVWVRSLFRCKKLQSICKLIFQAVVYGLWKERNSRLHSGVLKPAAILVKEIQLSIRAKLLGLDRRQHKFSNASSTTPIATESFLLTWFRFIQR